MKNRRKPSLTAAWLLVLLLPGCASKNSDLNARKEKIEAMENSGLSPDQEERKARSIAYCEQFGVPVLDNLPAIESESEITLRTKDEVIARALALCYLGLKSEGLEENHLQGFDKKYGVTGSFSSEEDKYVLSTNPTQQQTTDANWRYESLHVLLWALGHIDSLKYPSEVCNVGDDVKIIFSKTKEQFVSTSTLRSKKEILDQADLIYRLHWATTNARVNNSPAPGSLDSSVVYERHYVLNWLIRYMNQDWDDVSTDT